MKRLRIGVVLVLLSLAASAAAAQASLPEWTAQVANDYRVVPNVTYLTASNWEAKLDVYVPARPGPHPTVLHLHGGGWVGGTKEGVALRMLPYLEMGFAVVNATYRLGRVALAPAAVEDCRCALQWIGRNAKDYGFDTSRIVATGYSAGGHLSLTTGMLTPAAGLDRQCPGDVPRVAAVVNWYGITDVVDLLDGANMKTYAVAWLGSLPNREEIARRVSPLSYVRKDLPPILSIHGDADPTVPYSHATRLQEALKKAGATTELVTIPGGRHGGFPPPEQARAFAAVRAFLGKHGIVRAGTSSQ